MSPRSIAPVILLVLFCGSLTAEVRRVVILKLDGVPQQVLERELQRTDPITRKSALPWMERVFENGGTRLANFYVRSISLSAPSWSMLDTGQHLQIRGNAEFDRYTYHIYDYLNFFPFYLGYALSRRVDMPGVEVFDDLGVPLLIDRFSYQSTYQSFQLFQRGVRWKTLQRSVQQRFSKSPRQLLDEWTMGFEIGSSVEEQTERELIQKLADTQVQYLDYFTGDYDHVAHSTPDLASQRMALQRLDALVGRVWTAIEASPLALQTVLVAISDHGMNTTPGVYSQGYDLLEFFNSRAGGGHHVVTDRHPMTEYKLKGLDPFVSEVVTPSEDSFYLKGNSQYPTALLDPDGNERASVYLRSSDLSVLHILLEELSHSPLKPEMRRAAGAAFFQIVESHRAGWQAMLKELRAELAELHPSIDRQRRLVEAQPKRWPAAQRLAGFDKASRRLGVQLEAWRDQERGYTTFADALSKILALTPADFDKHKYEPSELIPKRVMGDANTVHNLQNYVVGPAPGGLVLASDGSLDWERSFQRIDYLPVLSRLAVQNNVQPNVSSHPVDYVALRLPKASLASDQDPVWLYGDENRQAVILSRYDPAGRLELRYLPVKGLREDAAGKYRFETIELSSGFPLRLFEDPNLDVPASERAQWLNSWHSELDWMRAVHKTEYSNGILALHEQFLREELPQEAGLLQRFNARKRRLAEPDFVIFANDHWNFNVRGFNPGGNHGSMRRISTHSVLMLAGGGESGIPRSLVIEEPYDSLSFVPTILDLMGLNQDARKLPGRPISELRTQSGRPNAR